VGWTHPPAVYIGDVAPEAPINVIGDVAPEAPINACLLGLISRTGTKQADGIVLAFRGTLPPTNLHLLTQLRDWLQNFEAKPIAPPGGFPPGVMVHEGFWNALDSLWPQIVPALQALQAANPQAKLYITGHSKGGALAPLAAARLSFQKATKADAVYIYAPARAGNSDFVSTFPAQIPVVRYEHHLDIVPFLPPNLDHWGVFAQIPPLDEIFKNAAQWSYTPLGTLRYIQQDGTVVGDSAGLSAKREEEILRALATGGAADIAIAHAPWCKRALSDGGYMLGVCPTGVCP